MNKTFVRSMLALMVIGALIATAGYAMGGKTAIYYSKGSGPKVSTGEPNSLDIRDQLQFTELDVEVSVAQVHIVRGNSFRLEARYYDGTEPGYALEGGVLKVFDSGIQNNRMSFNVGVGIMVNETNRVTITIPASYGIIRANVTSDVGSVNIKQLDCDSLDARSGVGTVDLKDVRCGALDASADVGSVQLSAVTTERSFIGKSGTGSVKGSGTFGGTVELSTDVGSIDISTTIARDQYLIDAKADLGQVRLRPDAADPASAPNTMTLRSGVGGITCRFD